MDPEQDVNQWGGLVRKVLVDPAIGRWYVCVCVRVYACACMRVRVCVHVRTLCVCVCACVHERVRTCVVCEGGVVCLGVLVCAGGTGVSRCACVWGYGKMGWLVLLYVHI